MKAAGGAALLSAVAARSEILYSPSGDGGTVLIPSRVISRTPPLRWEDALVSGNGSTGVMVMGLPLDDLMIVNHTKFWTVGTNVTPHAPDLRKAWKAASKIAQEGRYLDADNYLCEEARRIIREMYGDKMGKGKRLSYDRTHPGFHLHIATESNGAPERYRREVNLETGEIAVFWTDNRGDWIRRTFVSRTHNVIAMEITAPAGAHINAALRLTEAPGKLDGDIRSINIEHGDAELYIHAVYGRTMGKNKAEGYHALARVVVHDGTTGAAAGERLEVKGAERMLLLMRVEYLDDAAGADRAALRSDLAKLPDDYQALLAAHAAVHGEMFRRVTLSLGGDPEKSRASEKLITQASQGQALPEFFELMHAVGRYALICCGTGDLPPSLMGIWGNEWAAPWDGRYTFDANLNLAMSAASQGNLPEVMNTYTAFLERHLDDWRENAQKLYGCRGILTDLCQGWRHGIAVLATYPWTGGAGWLSYYLYDHYLFTQDREFLRKHVVPLLKETAEFYEDFLRLYPEKNGRAVFYPSISPENTPIMTPENQRTNVVPNATGEISICRQALTQLISACRELGIEKENIPRWEALQAKLPDYVINQDGALAEWAYPGLGDNYNHRCSSHIYGVYPSLEISPGRTPALFKAAGVAIEKRLEVGLGGKTGHGYMHVSLIAARLKNPKMLWRMLQDFARTPFVNTSLMTCHNPGPSIYCLDTTFSMPAVMTEMLVYSEAGLVELFPALPQELFSRGTLRGVLARGGVVVEELGWNMTLRGSSSTLYQAHVRLRSSVEQALLLRLGVDMRFVKASDPEDRGRVSKEKTGWRIHLPAGRALRLCCLA